MASDNRYPIKGLLGLTLLVMFLFGGTVGYIVRDVRADEQVRQAAAEARRDLQQTALEALERVQRAGADLSAGAKAAAESTKAAVDELAGDGEQQPEQPAKQEEQEKDGS